MVDDHLIYRKGLKSIVTIENIAIVIGATLNGVEFIDMLPQLKPDLVIMDIDMPLMNGIEATQKALEIIPDLKIIIYTMFEEEDYSQKMIALSVKGFIIKSSSIQEVEKVIDEVMKGNTYFSNEFQVKNTNKFNSNATINPLFTKGFVKVATSET